MQNASAASLISSTVMPGNKWSFLHSVYDADSPKLSPEALKEFAFMAAERNRQRRQAVTIRVVPDCLTKYKSLGKGYTGIMADVLNYVANNPKILSKASGNYS